MHVVVNVAVSADGKLSSRNREQIEISGQDDFARVDRLRAESDAVMVGIGTVLSDDPSLSIDRPRLRERRRDRGDPPQPARVIADSEIRIPPDSTVLDETAKTFLLASEAASEGSLNQMQSLGARVITAGDNRVDLAVAFEQLDAAGVDQLLVEGGGEIIFSLFESGLVDELSVFVGPLVIGGRGAPTLADGEGFVSDFPELVLTDVRRVDDGAVLRYECG